MKTEQRQSDKFSDNPKSTLYSGLFYTFLILTSLAFVFRLVGLNWFASNVHIEEPPIEIQKVLNLVLKSLELTFVYKILTRKSFITCGIVSVSQTCLTAFLGAGIYQSAADLFFWFSIPFASRKDRGQALLDSLLLYLILTVYSLSLLIGKFGEITGTQVYSFYEAVLGIVDYKLFIVTAYFYLKYKGGVRIWKKRPKFLMP